MFYYLTFVKLEVPQTHDSAYQKRIKQSNSLHTKCVQKNFKNSLRKNKPLNISSMNLECFMSTIGVAENKVKEFKGIKIKLDITNNTSE